MHRRTLLKTMALACLIPITGLMSPLARATTWLRSAFEAKTLTEVRQQLQLEQAVTDPTIRIEAPQKAENGAVVQVEVQVSAQAGAIHQLNLIAEQNPTPLIARAVLAASVLPRMVTRIKLAQTGAVQAVVQTAQGALRQQSTQVEVLEDGCASNEREAPFSSSMKLRARLQADGITELKIIILHPMRTGRSKGDDGQLLSAHFMQTLQVRRQGQALVEVQTGTAISRNPYFTFYLTELTAGDTLNVSWQDNLGYHGEADTAVVI